MQIHEFEVVSIALFLFGLYALVKGRLNFKLVSGQSGMNTIIDESSPKKVLKEVQMGPITTRIFGLAIIAISTIVFFNFKGEVMFSV
jgi:hypothetical protein